MPLISVVIPTRHRPEPLSRAIRSVLEQTCKDLEIIVVVDGPDEETVAALGQQPEARVHVLALAQNVGLAEARNLGVRAASGKWIALLDDDDEWLPEKLERQLATAEQLHSEYVFVGCRFLEKTRLLERVMPLSLPAQKTHLSEYIYCEGGYLQPSTFFASRALLITVPFTRGLRHIEDTDWLLRCFSETDLCVAIVPDTLSIYHNYKDETRESQTTPWGVPLAWAKQNTHLFSRRAFPYYIARLFLDARRARRPWRTYVELLWLAFRHGRVTPKVLLYFVAYACLPDESLKSWRKRILEVRSRLRLQLAPTRASRPAS